MPWHYTIKIMNVANNFVLWWNFIYVFVDINECQTGTDNCQQNCINTHGSFICSCESGYIMNSDGATCTGTGCI